MPNVLYWKMPRRCCYADSLLRKRLDIDIGAMRVANYIKSLTEETKMLAQLTGHNDIKKFSKDDLRAINLETAQITA